MRIHLIDTLTVCNPNHLQEFYGSLLNRFLCIVFILMKEEDLIDLISNPENRIQGSHRLLENHGHKVAAKMLHDMLRSLRNLIDLFTRIQTNGAFHNLSLRTLQQLHERKAGYGLSATGLSYNADRFS